ncbi:TPA: hypothetical protein N0F65_006019 [Lagenidium giganteum]|uniref:CDP-diacylglycerol--glycerol-3-phosphate 3-phosphatidyltransferase n=1 Tax=Lagenidium giganteum TaxID=4803 RepID=A0AAV2Z3F7_9STRA|nr:TPA: hypothetical protein N0F65_006019 [Lagenidium giganteum]
MTDAPPAPTTAPRCDFEHIFRTLRHHSRVFPLNSADVRVIATPTEFYEQLLTNIRGARHRITISSLYLGTGELEQQLVRCLHEQLQANPGLKVQIVLDYSRGQRGGQTRSSVAMLKPLLAQYPQQCQLFLYKVPQLNGVKAFLPPPFNETMGVSHAKVYLVDDVLVLSGANLSEDYFTNRQDRYVQMANCGALATFYHEFVDIVAAHAFRVKLQSDKKQTYELEGVNNDTAARMQVMKQAFQDLVEQSKHPDDHKLNFDANDTWAFPTIQFSPINMTQDEELLTALMPMLPAQSSLSIASGYLNFPPFLEQLLVESHAHLDVLAAAPKANGFFKANGVKGALPMAYSLIEQEFYDQTRSRGGLSTHIREFGRPSWTFHGKGMWFSPQPGGTVPLTIMGSSNFGRRSYGCDLESQLVMYTKNPALRESFRQEYSGLTQHAELVNDQVWQRADRRLKGLFCWQYGHWIRPVARMISSFL